MVRMDGDTSMSTLAKLIVAVTVSWFIASHAGMTPLDGIETMQAVGDAI